MIEEEFESILINNPPQCILMTDWNNRQSIHQIRDINQTYTDHEVVEKFKVAGFVERNLKRKFSSNKSNLRGS